MPFLPDEIAPTDWAFMTYREIMYLDSIKVEENECFEIEQKTVLQSNSSVWFNLRRNRITSRKSLFLKKTLIL